MKNKIAAKRKINNNKKRLKKILLNLKIFLRKI